jgi:hypothetical protein
LSDSTATNSLAVQTPIPLGDDALALDRVDAQVKTLQQQALATQTSIQQMQGRPAVDPLNAIMAELPALPHINATAAGVFVGVALALFFAGWYVWKRPKNQHTQPVRQDFVQEEVHDPLSLWGTLHDPQAEGDGTLANAPLPAAESDPDAFMSMAQFGSPESTQPVAVQPQQVAPDSKRVDIEF